MTVTRIALLAPGGTISAVADARRADGGEGAAALARSVACAVELVPIDVARVPSRAMTPELMWLLAVAATTHYGNWATDWWIVLGCLALIVFAMWQQNRLLHAPGAQPRSSAGRRCRRTFPAVISVPTA
jgi:hypothetical protein